ncbi:hypothetical protein Tsubulata_027282, partial [Turnera subulata]
AYNCEIVKRHFECSACITVSQTYSIEDLLRSSIRQFYEAAKQAVLLDLITMSYRQLVEMLVNYLVRKRYVVVLDDVLDTELWNNIKDVAAKFFQIRSNIHYIKPLAENEAWTLFCMKAFPWNARRCPQELEDLAKDVEKCHGLPLAVVSLGGLFSTKRSELEWKTTYNSLNWELSNNSMLQPIKSILLLSYNDLPYRLKHCFLYCCLFPEDYEIERERLARLWMVVGCIENGRGLTQEEIANRYLVELIRRCLLQVVDIYICGLPIACKMHDMLREEKFCALYDEQIGTRREEGVMRRLSIQGSREEIKPWEGMTQLRPTRCSYRNISGPHHHLVQPEVEALPNGIVNLRNLKYLLSNQLKDETVDFNFVIGTRFPPKVNTLNNLQVLGIVEANSIVVKEIRSMTKLVGLFIPNGFISLQNLRDLSLYWSRLANDPLSHLEALPNLRSLSLHKACRSLAVSNDLIKRIDEPSGVDRSNVHHIPKIIYFYKTSSCWFERNLSSFVMTFCRWSGRRGQ